MTTTEEARHNSELSGRAWAHLLTDELHAKAAVHRVTEQAYLYMAGGLIDIDGVLDALKISRATWYRRLDALNEHRATNLAAGRRMDEQKAADLDRARAEARADIERSRAAACPDCGNSVACSC